MFLFLLFLINYLHLFNISMKKQADELHACYFLEQALTARDQDIADSLEFHEQLLITSELPATDQM